MATRTYEQRAQDAFEWIKQNRQAKDTWKQDNEWMSFEDWLFGMRDHLAASAAKLPAGTIGGKIDSAYLASVFAGKIVDETLIDWIELYLEADSEKYGYVTEPFHSTRTLDLYGIFGHEPMEQQKKWGGQREGAGRPQDSAKAHTREPLYQEGYNAGYQAGRRANRKAQTMAEKEAYEAGRKLYDVESLTDEELDKAAEKYALEYCGEPAGRSTSRYDAYEQFFNCKDWFKAGFNSPA